MKAGITWLIITAYVIIRYTWGRGHEGYEGDECE